MASTAAAFCLLSFLFLSLRPPPFAAAQPPPPPNQARDPLAYARVTPSMAVIVIVLMIALFVLGFFSIYVRRRAIAAAVGGGGGSFGNRSRRGGAAAASRGLDQAVIETFPTMIYSAVKGMKIGKEDLECAVCLNEFDDDETLRLIPNCDHVFHPECIDAWLESHTTCPVCRANLAPQPGDSAPPSQLTSELGLTRTATSTTQSESDLEAGPQTDAVLDRVGDCERETDTEEVVVADRVLNRNRTRGRPRKFPRSHSTGHSVVQPGENTDRFTLKLPADVRKRLMVNRELNRTMSLIALPREGSTRRGYRMDGANSGKYSKYRKLEPLETESKSNRWTFNRTSSFLTRASSFLTRASSSVRSPRVVGRNDEGGPSSRPVGQDTIQSVRPPV